MQITKPQLKPGTLGVYALLIFGYLMLVLVIVFKDEINLALTPSSSAVAQVRAAAVEETMLEDEVPASDSVIASSDFDEYLSGIFNHPDNLQTITTESPAEAYAKGLQTKFLIGL